MAFSFFSKKTPARPPAKGPALPRRQEVRKAPVPPPVELAEEDAFSLDFTNYAPPVTVLSEPPAEETAAHEPAPDAPAARSLPPLDFSSLPGAHSNSVAPSQSPVNGQSVPEVAAIPSGLPEQPGGEDAPNSVLVIEMESGAQEVPTVVEEAAVLYANGQAQEALDALNRAIETGNLDNWTLPTWLMRFDLYQQLGRKSEFEEKALHFIVKFERSPPAWVDAPDEGEGPSAPGGSAHIALSGSLSAGSAGAIEQMLKAAERHPKLHLDFSRLEGADADGCNLLLETLRRLRQAKKEVYISGEARAFELLGQQSKAGDPTVDPAVWLLRLDLYQQLGMNEEFEDAAIEYAVTYEVSPPSWEARPRVEAPAAPDVATPAGARDPADDSYRLAGDIAGPQDALFADLLSYAEAASPVVIDCSAMRRIDFINAGRLLHIIEKAKEGKRAVVLRAVSEMTIALFAVMGIHKLARIIPRK